MSDTRTSVTMTPAGRVLLGQARAALEHDTGRRLSLDAAIAEMARRLLAPVADRSPAGPARVA